MKVSCFENQAIGRIRSVVVVVRDVRSDVLREDDAVTGLTHTGDPRDTWTTD